MSDDVFDALDDSTSEPTSDPIEDLKGVDHWVEWGREDPPKDKRPYSPTRGHATGHDIDKEEQWGAYDDCWEKRGFVITGTDFWGIDIDDASVNTETYDLECTRDVCPNCDIQVAQKIMELYAGDSYWETSPSGQGHHMVGKWAEMEFAFKAEEAHLEVYSDSRYFTVTEDEDPWSAGDINWTNPTTLIAELNNYRGADGPEHESAISVTDVDDEAVLDAISHLPDDLGYHDWLNVLYGIHSWDSTEGGRDVALEWSRESPKYDGEGGETETQIEWVWNNADSGGKITVATVFHYAKENGWSPPPGTMGADWDAVRAAFRDEDTSPVTKRDRAFRAIMAETEFMSLRDTEAIWRYDGRGIFKKDGEQHVGARLAAELGPFFTSTLENEVINRLRKSTWADRDDVGSDLLNPLICFENCIVNMQTGEMLPHSPEHKLITRIPVKYDPNAETTEFDKFLRKQLEGDQDRIDTVYEIMASALAPGLPLDNFVIIHGPPGTGKSTLIKVMERLLGEENTSSESLHRLAHDNHAMTSLYGAKANLAGDMDSTSIKRTGLILQLSSGDLITGNPKGEKQFEFHSEAELVFSTNDLPNFKNNLEAIARRLVTVEMPVEIPEDDYEPSHKVMARLASDDELTGIAANAVKAYQRLMKQNKFTAHKDTTMEERREAYRMKENPVARFLEACTSEDHHAQVPRAKVYDAYHGWRVATGARTLTKSQLTERLREFDGIETTRPSGSSLGLNEDRIRCYKGFKLTDDGQANASAWADRDTESGEVTSY